MGRVGRGLNRSGGGQNGEEMGQAQEGAGLVVVVHAESLFPSWAGSPCTDHCGLVPEILSH